MSNQYKTSNRKEDVVATALIEMFRRVGERYSPGYIKVNAWYVYHSWTYADQDSYVEWLAFQLKNWFSLDEKQAQKEACWFVYKFGWNIKRS